jgi:hypothetical protein
MVTVIKKDTASQTIKSLLEQGARQKPRKKIDIERYCGTIKLTEDPLLLQKKWRDDWK